jgi:hypothetical protein
MMESRAADLHTHELWKHSPQVFEGSEESRRKSLDSGF